MEGGHKAVIKLLLKAKVKVDYEYTVNVNKSTLNLVYFFIKSIANPNISSWYSV